MAFEITDQGVQVQTFEEIFSEIVEAYKAIYGDDINVDQDSPDGQRIGIDAKTRLDFQSFAASIFNQQDPDFATGLAQQQLLKLSGLFLRSATRSQVELDITVDRDLTLDDDYTVKDDLEQRWVIDEGINLLTGTTSVTFFAEDFGQVEADPDTITTQVTVVLGVTNITNPLAASAGKPEETEAEVRLRRNRSTENPAFSTVGQLFSRLANLADVIDVVVYENDSDVYDAIRDIPAHTIWVVIDGGSLTDIAETMVKNKTTGAGTKGTISQEYIEEVERPDGTTFPISHVMRFDRETDKDLFIRMTATRKDPSSPVNIPLIKSELEKRKFRISESALATELYSSAYQAGTNYILTDLEISDDDVVYTDDSLSPGFDGRFNITAANIDITEVI